MENERKTCSCGRTIALTEAAKKLFFNRQYYFCQWCGDRFEVATGNLEQRKVLERKAVIYNQMKAYGFCSGCRFQGSYHDCERGCVNHRNWQIKEAEVVAQ